MTYLFLFFYFLRAVGERLPRPSGPSSSAPTDPRSTVPDHGPSPDCYPGPSARRPFTSTLTTPSVSFPCGGRRQGRRRWDRPRRRLITGEETRTRKGRSTHRRPVRFTPRTGAIGSYAGLLPLCPFPIGVAQGSRTSSTVDPGPILKSPDPLRKPCPDTPVSSPWSTRGRPGPRPEGLVFY